MSYETILARRPSRSSPSPSIGPTGSTPSRTTCARAHRRLRSCRRGRRGARRHRDRRRARVLRRRRSCGGRRDLRPRRAARSAAASDSDPTARRTSATRRRATAADGSPCRIFSSLKPVIAAVNGPAVGIGVTMLLPMDVRIASTDARFGFVFVRRGIVPEACSSWFLPRIVGIAKALEWRFSGRVFPAEEALAGRLVSAVHPPAELHAGGPRDRPRDRRQYRAGVGGADAPDDVADARRRPSDGGPQDRQPRNLHARRKRRRT